MNDLNNRQLKFGYWYVTHRDWLKAGLFGLVGAGLLLLLAYSGWQITAWLINLKNEEAMLKQLVDSRVETYDYNRRHAPQEIEFGYKAAVPAGSGRYDLVATVRNNNEDWAVTQFSYVLTADGREFTGSSWLLPKEDKYLIIPQVELSYRPTQLDLRVNSLSWRRIKTKDSYPWPDFSVQEEKFEQLPTVDSNQSSSARLTFTLVNSSAYSYAQVPINAILLRGNEVVAVARQVLSEVISGQSKPVEFYWPGQTIYADRLLIKPEVNIFEIDNLLSL
ncbi:MAG: hypothetical protein ACOZAJ_04335 [Patescibacteria group bacterium]